MNQTNGVNSIRSMIQSSNKAAYHLTNGRVVQELREAEIRLALELEELGEDGDHLEQHGLAHTHGQLAVALLVDQVDLQNRLRARLRRALKI